ncbi:MAG: outer membrane beta-barrel protein [Bacteroidales bacterium]|nr:outer membrane beta-barrel protein [Bacteroidales bacterium]
MKKLLLVASLILVFATTYGQGEKTAMFKLRGGVSVPIGLFGKNSGNLDYSGFVSRGLNFGAEAVYFYNENVGLGGLLSYSSINVDNNRLAGAYINSNDDYDTAIASVNPFKTIVGAIGFYFDLPVSDYFAFTIKMLVGSHIVERPEGVTTVDDKAGMHSTITETSTFDSQFALYTGAGMRINPYDKWNLTIEVEYIGSNMEFDYKKDGIRTISNEAVKTLVLSFGIAYFLD